MWGYNTFACFFFVLERHPVILTYRQTLRPTRAQHRLITQKAVTFGLAAADRDQALQQLADLDRLGQLVDF